MTLLRLLPSRFAISSNWSRIGNLSAGIEKDTGTLLLAKSIGIDYYNIYYLQSKSIYISVNCSSGNTGWSAGGGQALADRATEPVALSGVQLRDLEGDERREL